jgi:hypothetical protein
MFVAAISSITMKRKRRRISPSLTLSWKVSTGTLENSPAQHYCQFLPPGQPTGPPKTEWPGPAAKSQLIALAIALQLQRPVLDDDRIVQLEVAVDDHLTLGGVRDCLFLV